MQFEDCIVEFLYDCECRGLSKGTLRNYRAQLTLFLHYLKEENITHAEDIKPQHIRNFLRTKQNAGCKPTYINDLLKVIKTIYNYMEQEDLITFNAAKKVKNVKQPKVIIETFSEAEVRALIKYYDGNDYLSIRNRTMLAMFFDTGIRCNELIMMSPEDIAFDYILVKHGKGNKERVVPKSPYLSKQLIRYLRVRDGYFGDKILKHDNLFLSKRGKPLTGGAITKILKTAAEDVGVSPAVRVSPHTCRHTFAHLQLKNGLDVYSLSRLMGHVNISITQRYLQGLRDRDIVNQSKRTSPLMNL